METWWPDFRAAIAAASSIPGTAPSVPDRPTEDILSEILQEVRELSKGRTSAALESDRVLVDTRPLLGSDGRLLEVRDVHRLSVSDFLDEIWHDLSQMDDVPPYTYGTKWMLYRATGEALSELGRPYIESLGRKRDNRNLRKFAIQGGDLLEVRKGTAS